MIKRKILLSLVSIACLVSQNIPSSETAFKNLAHGRDSASLKGFDIPVDFNYVIDFEPSEYKDIYSGTRLYGKMNMWVGIYSFYDEGSKTMYFACLTQISIEPSKAQSWDLKGMFNEYMDIHIFLDSRLGTLENTIPSTSEIIASTTHTLHLSIKNNTDSQGNTTMGYDFKLGWIDNMLTPSITISDRVTDKNKTDIYIRYNFANYKSNNKEDVSHDFVQKNTLSIISVPNYYYLRSMNERLHIGFDYTASIYRNGKINSSSKTEKESYTYHLL